MKPSLTQQLKRVSALQYNYLFSEEVEKIRRKYKVPKDPSKAVKWINEYQNKEIAKEVLNGLKKEFGDSIEHTKNLSDVIKLIKRSKKKIDSERPHTTEEATEIESWLSPYSMKRVPYEPIVIRSEDPKEYHSSLSKDIRKLLTRFRLPLTMEFFIKRYIISNNKEWLIPDLLEPFVTLDIEIHGGLPTIQTTVYGIYPWITQEQWTSIWAHEILPQFKAVMGNQQESRIWEASRKRHTLKSFREQMERRSAWYQLSEVERLGPVKALEKWEREHPDESGKFDQSTVTKAIREFREIMTPIEEEVNL